MRDFGRFDKFDSFNHLSMWIVGLDVAKNSHIFYGPEMLMTREELLEKATELQGSREAAEQLISQPAMALDYAVPEQLIQTEEGSALVRTWLIQLDHGVYI
jgi:Antitoxin Xre/MbcA/ParS C-terminal toxin-binding domain